MLKKITKYIIAILLFILCFSLTNSYVFADISNLNLDIEVFQALRENVTGTDMENEYVKIGIPFPQGMLKEIDGKAALAVDGAEFQSRVLKKWSDGSVKWAIIGFLASVKKNHANKISLKHGSGAVPGKYLATKRGETIWVDTGPLKVEVKTKGFNIFSKVILEDNNILQADELGGVILIDGEGKEFKAALCENTEVVIEENGPVEASIRVDGAHCNDKKELLEYTMRLFFYKGKTGVKVQYTLRNASKKNVDHVFIKSLMFDTKLNLDDRKRIVVSTHNGPKNMDFENNKNIVFYQAVSDFPWLSDGNSFYYHGPVQPDYSREWKRGYKQEGYRIWRDGELLFRSERNEYPDVAYIDISDLNGRGLAVGVRYMAGNWPKALKADTSGGIIVSLWPEENEAGYWIRYGSHTTFEIMYFFHADNSVKPEDEMKRFQYPLVARAPIEWYNKNADYIYPLYHFISFNDEKKLADELDIDYRVGWRKPRFKVWRYHYWGHGGFLNQHDFARIALVNFLRDDRSLVKAGEFYLLAESIFQYYADWAVYHSDDYDYSKIQFKPKENNKKAELAKVVFEFEHQHWYGMPLYYYMTGDERIKEAVIDLGDYIKSISNPLSLTYMRVFGTGMFSLAAMYEFTGDKEFLRLADMNFVRLLGSKYNPREPYANIFVDWQRGSIIGGSGSGWNPENPAIKADLMLGSLMYDGLLNYYFQMEKDNPLKEKAYDVLEGVSEFMYHEPYIEGVKKGRQVQWIPYVYNLSDKNKSKHDYRLAGQASFCIIIPYLFTGEERWIDKAKKMIKTAIVDNEAWGSYGYIDHPGYQTIAYLILKNYKVERVNQVSAFKVDYKNGRIYLSWTVPEGIEGYRIKYSNKKIVRYLQYDTDSKTFKYPPESFINWWSAENIKDEPAPLLPGDTQSYSFVPEHGTYYFALRTIKGDMVGDISHEVEAEVR